MKRLATFFCLLVACIFPSSLLAASLFLKDGGEIECQSYRQEGNRIVVRINDETNVDFALDEVDFDKTARPGPMPAKVQLEVRQRQVVDGPMAREKLQRDVQALLTAKRFADLETLAQRLRAAKERFPEGHWKLMYFYRGVEKPVGQGAKKWQRHLALLEQWRQSYPQSVTARVAAANAWLEYGWEARGGGYASTVSDDGWKLLRERTAKAYDLVREPPARDGADCPERHAVLLLVGKAEGWRPERFNAMFQAAVRFEPDYGSFYATTMDYLSPKWQGDDESWHVFIEKADAIAGRPEGREFYARMMVGMWRDTWTSFDDTRVSWAKMKQGYREMEQRFPGSPYNLNNFAKFACLARDLEVGRELFTRIGDAPYFAAWQRKDPDFETCRKEFGVSGVSRQEIVAGRKHQEAVQQRALAESGDPFSQHRVAVDYSQGEVGKVQDHALAFRLAEAAAEQGYAPAQSWLALMYESGKGVLPDQSAALRWLEKAAEQGDDSGMFFLPTFYERQHNPVKAFIWYAVSKDKKWAQQGMERLEKSLPPKNIADATREAERIALKLAATN